MSRGYSLIHRCPIGDSSTMPCCGRTPFEVPRADRLTTVEEMVTCEGHDSKIAACEASLDPIAIPHTCGLEAKMFFQGNPHTHDGRECEDWAHCTRTSDQQRPMEWRP